MRSSNYSTNQLRASLGLAAGAVTGALAVALNFLWAAAQGLGIDGIRPQDLQFILLASAIAFVVWVISLIVVGLPGWWQLHKRGRRSWLAAIVFGAVATFLVDFGLSIFNIVRFALKTNGSYSASDSGGPTIINNHTTAHGWWNAFAGSLTLSIIGALVALVIWRIAYRRTDSGASQQ